MSKRALFILAVFLASGSPSIAETAVPASIQGQVFLSPTCNCCSTWTAYMTKNGFALESKAIDTKELHRFKTLLGVKPPQASCHTAMIGGYVVEGHVPAEDVKRLLQEKPEALGVTVPNMPIGSPGMEQGETKQPYEVLLMRKDGTTEVFAKH